MTLGCSGNGTRSDWKLRPCAPATYTSAVAAQVAPSDATPHGHRGPCDRAAPPRGRCDARQDGDSIPASSSAAMVSPKPWFHDVSRVVREVDIRLDVGPAVLVHDRALASRSTGTPTTSRPSARSSSQRPQHRVPLPDEQPPARPQEAGHDPGPAADVGQPAQGADAGVDQVEAAPRRALHGVVGVGLDEIHVGAGRSAIRRASARAAPEKSSPVIVRRGGRARRCRCRCGTAGGRRAARRCRRAAAGRICTTPLRWSGSCANSRPRSRVMRVGGGALVPAEPIDLCVIHGFTPSSLGRSRDR